MNARKVFFSNSLGLGIFGLTKGDYNNAQLCFTADGKNEQVDLEISYQADVDTLEIKSTDGISYSKDAVCWNVVKPTLAYLEQQFSTVEGVIKVKATLTGKDRTPMELEADSTGWKWPSYYIEGDTAEAESK